MSAAFRSEEGDSGSVQLLLNCVVPEILDNGDAVHRLLSGVRFRCKPVVNVKDNRARRNGYLGEKCLIELRAAGNSRAFMEADYAMVVVVFYVWWPVNQYLDGGIIAEADGHIKSAVGASLKLFLKRLVWPALVFKAGPEFVDIVVAHRWKLAIVQLIVLHLLISSLLVRLHLGRRGILAAQSVTFVARAQDKSVFELLLDSQ